MLIFVVFEKSHRFFSPSKFDPFSKIVQITSKYAQKHHIEKQSEKFTHWKNFKFKNCENGQKRAENGRFLVLEGRILTLFSQFFANHF